MDGSDCSSSSDKSRTATAVRHKHARPQPTPRRSHRLAPPPSVASHRAVSFAPRKKWRRVTQGFRVKWDEGLGFKS